MRGNLLQGTAHGRMGEIVAKVTHGTQVFSKYQPNVMNPKSTKQLLIRSYFANAVIALKLFLNFGISNTQVLYRGASKAWNAGIISLSILAQRSRSNLSYNVSGVVALANTVINGNTFEIASTGLTTKLLTREGTSPTTAYFGSISPISATLQFVQLGSAAGIISGITIAKVLAVCTSVAPSPEISRNQGFHTSAAACGDWPFVYAIDTIDGVIGAGITKIGTFTPLSFNHIILADNGGDVLAYAFELNPLP